MAGDGIIVSKLPDILSLALWLLAAALYVWHWLRPRRIINQMGDVVVLAGLVFAVWSIVWKSGTGWPHPAINSNALLIALGVFSLLVYAALAGYRSNRLAVVPILIFAIAVQIYVLATSGTVVNAGGVFLPILAGIGALFTFIGYGALVVAVTSICLSSILWRIQDRLPVVYQPGDFFLEDIGGDALRTALIALSLALGMNVARSWWGRGQVMDKDFAWALATWLLAASAVWAVALMARSRRLSRFLILLAFVAALVATTTMLV